MTKMNHHTFQQQRAVIACTTRTTEKVKLKKRARFQNKQKGWKLGE